MIPLAQFGPIYSWCMLDATRLRVLVAIAKHGSVTAAAQALNYAQPSISHHMARLESETGAKLMERSGRGIRLTDAGRLLAERAEEILGRLDAAEAELAAHLGLRQERVRLAAFGSALGTLAAAAGSALRADRAGTDVSLFQAEPTDALRMLRIGEVDVALVFRYLDPGHKPDDFPAGAPDGGDLHCRPVLDEPVYLITAAETPQPPSAGSHTPPASPHAPSARVQAAANMLADYAGHRWIAGCERCQDALLRLCRTAGFSPDIAVTTDDYAAAQALVAAGLGVTILPGLALRAMRHPGVTATKIPGARRQVLALTYGGPPEPPAATALLAALTSAAAMFHGPREPGRSEAPRPRSRLTVQTSTGREAGA
jgi:DNA-binding transcriptional LysR family regulator